MVLAAVAVGFLLLAFLWVSLAHPMLHARGLQDVLHSLRLSQGCCPRADVLPESLRPQPPDECLDRELILLDVVEGGVAMPSIRVKIINVD